MQEKEKAWNDRTNINKPGLPVLSRKERGTQQNRRKTKKRRNRTKKKRINKNRRNKRSIRKIQRNKRNERISIRNI